MNPFAMIAAVLVLDLSGMIGSILLTVIIGAVPLILFIFIWVLIAIKNIRDYTKRTADATEEILRELKDSDKSLEIKQAKKTI